MSAHLPKYLLGLWSHHTSMSTPANTGDPDKDLMLDLANAELRHSIGEYHVWTPSETPAAGDLCFVVMRQARHRQPHPEWQMLPHVYKHTSIQDHHKQKLTGWAKAHFDNARLPDGSYKFGALHVAAGHDVVDLALALHDIQPVFEP